MPILEGHKMKRVLYNTNEPQTTAMIRKKLNDASTQAQIVEKCLQWRKQ